MSPFTTKPLFHFNIFTPKPGRIDDFITAQLESASRLGQIPGLNESRLYRAEDGSRAIVVAGFDSVETFKQFQHGAMFQAERARLHPFLEGAQPAFYRLIHERPPGG